MFGDGASARAACNHELLDSLALHDGIATTIAIEDDLCDDGLVVSGAFRVILRYADGSRMIERPLLVQGSLGSTARRPSVAVVDRSDVLIVGQKDLVVEQGPTEAAGIRFTYKLE